MINRTNSLILTRLAAVILALLPALSRADYVEASRHAHIYSAASSHSAPLPHDANADDQFAILSPDKTNGFYSISTPDGPGFIYKTCVRRWPGALPAAAPSSASFTTGIFITADGIHCPPEGQGGDPDLSRLKNRDLPPHSYSDMSVEQIIETVVPAASEMGEKARAKWSAEARAEVAAIESRGIRIEGFLLEFDKRDAESCNCNSHTDVDRHLWLAGQPGSKDDRGEHAMVVEISPRLLPAHPKWADATLRQFVNDKQRVRISGWAMFDQEHHEQISKTRATLWEIHPIHKIEVQKNGQWISLDD
jgi:hypothetical protein